LIPSMTGASTPSGLAFASSSYATTPAWTAFAAYGSGNGWITNGGLPNSIGYEFPSTVIVTEYEVYPWDADNFPVRCFRDFQLQGSNDGSTWTTLDTQSAITSWTAGVSKRFVTTNTTSYLYYRIYVTQNVGGDTYTGSRHIAMYGPAP
jgi:hypothetical protein